MGAGPRGPCFEGPHRLVGGGLCQPRPQKGESILMGGAFMEVRMDKVQWGLGRVGATSSPWLVGLDSEPLR